MGCEPFRGPGNMVSFVCTRGRSATSIRPCSKCQRPGDLLCDGPPRRVRAKSCDASLCRDCAVSVRSLNVDFCPEHAREAPASCPCSGTSGVPCAGIAVPAANGLCLAHALLFEYWVAHAGGREVYRSPLPQEDKRQRFRQWLACMPVAGLDMILVAKRAR